MSNKCEKCAYHRTVICSKCDDKDQFVLNNIGVILNQMDIKKKMGSLVSGVGKDSPTVTNEQGGKQSAVQYAYDALDPQAMFAMTKVLKEGRDKYGSDENWRKISPKEHWNHLVIHAFAWLAGDKSDEHLTHIMCRAMFLYACAEDKS